jgi:two-component system, NarL family, response regulator DesR
VDAIRLARLLDFRLRAAAGPPPDGRRDRLVGAGRGSLSAAVLRGFPDQRAPAAPELASEAWSEGDPLTDRERQVLRLAADGQSGADIARVLHLSEGTVRNYLSEAVGKLGGRNKVDAAHIARAKGWL